jgi:hypothetical protein
MLIFHIVTLLLHLNNSPKPIEIYEYLQCQTKIRVISTVLSRIDNPENLLFPP